MDQEQEEAAAAAAAPEAKESPRDKPRKESSSKKEKLEKMMSPLKKTPHIFRQLTSKKEKDSLEALEKDAAGDDMPPSPTVSLLPLSDGRERRVVEGGNERGPASAEPSRLSRDTLRAFDGRSRDSLIEQVLGLQQELKKVKDELKKSKAQTSDLDEYLDTLLLRVMEAQPDLLQNPLRTAAGVKYAGRAC
ncbi:uncharacterized protein LOC119113177 [Pollicipes pollicipes]|uniref:uncharacterized protein LOC119113177 n=1 Tax=Pollicipes pollicipes TaxID=41117 RepID=UPI001884CBC4|nr:uncharacterized protein LOC119113177 [Pollicipes pollicipes]